MEALSVAAGYETAAEELLDLIRRFLGAPQPANVRLSVSGGLGLKLKYHIDAETFTQRQFCHLASPDSLMCIHRDGDASQ